ncbi:putative toxin-antitoxin system toxin component, PIN family [Candidatus Micrarchaeota archaeon]|nr:putative toxin-antitoxin system toxin component, PIN family [Candidatus Micrarchaeota archaeon]MBI5176524.1 putative toxin-antitoxin system toxin component, PIN family [Candidatus Micrarchaeota archaeon]
MLRLFIDANTLISGLVFSGPEHGLLKKGASRKVELITSEDVIDEVVEVINRKFPSKSVYAQEFLKLTEVKVIRKKEYETKIGEQTVRDLEDRHVLAAALAANCKIIVTGDGDLLALGNYKKIRIIRTTQILSEIN